MLGGEIVDGDPFGKGNFDALKRYLGDFVREIAKDSGLPGANGGIQDAYRHLIFAAEARRLTGRAGRWIITEHVEQQSYHPIHTPMDRLNNIIGSQIGTRSRSLEDTIRMVREVMREAIKHGGIGGEDADGILRVWWFGGVPDNLPEDWDTRPVPKHRFATPDQSYELDEEFSNAPTGRNRALEKLGNHTNEFDLPLRDARRSPDQRSERSSAPRWHSRPASSPKRVQRSSARNTRVPPHSPLREDQSVAEMSREDAREAIEDRMLDDDFIARLLRRDRAALAEWSELHAIAWPEGASPDTHDDDLPCPGLSPDEARRRADLARADTRFLKRLSSGDRAAKRRLRRLSLTASGAQKRQTKR